MSLDVGTVTGTLEVKDEFSGPLNMFHNLIQGIGVGAGIEAFNKIFEGVKKVVDVMPKAVGAYEQAEDAVFRLSAALQSQGQNTEENLTALRDQAEALMILGTVGDEEIMSIQKRFIMLGQSTEMTMKATEAVLNLSHATGKDAGEVSAAFVAAARGRTLALKQYGIVLDESVPKSQRLTEAIKQSSDRFAGLGGITTFSDIMKNLRLAEEEVWEAMGKGIVTSGKLTAVMGVVHDIAWKIVQVINANGETIRDWVNTGITMAVNALAYLAQGLMFANTAFTVIKSGIDVVGTYFSTLGKIIGKLWDDLTSGLSTVTGAFKSAWESIKNAVTLENVMVGLLELGKVIIRTGTSFLNTWDEIKAGASAVTSTIQGLGIMLGAAGKAMLEPWNAQEYLAQADAVVGVLDTVEQNYLKGVQEGIDTRNSLADQQIAALDRELGAELTSAQKRAGIVQKGLDYIEEIRKKIAGAADVTSPTARNKGTKPPPNTQDTRALEDYQRKVNEAFNSIYATIEKTSAELSGNPIAAGLTDISKAYSDALLKIPEFQKAASKAGQIFDVPQYTQAVGAMRDIQEEQLKMTTRQQVLGATFGDADVEVNRFNTTLAGSKINLSNLTNDSIQNLITKFQGYRDAAKAAGLPTEQFNAIILKLQKNLEARPGNFLRQLGEDAAKVASVANAAAGALTDMGLGDTGVAKVTEDVGGFASSVSDFAKAPDPFSKVVAGIAMFGKGVKLVGDLWSSVFGNKEWEKVNGLRDAWEDAYGSFEDLSKKAAAAGVANLMPEYLAAKTEKDWKTVSENLEKAFAAQDARDAFIKAAGGADELAEAAKRAGVPLTALFDARSKEAVDAYTESFNNLVDLQGQLADIAKDAASKIGNSMASAVDMSAYQKKILQASWDAGKLSAEQFDEGMASIHTNGIAILTPADAAAQASIAMMAFTLKVKQDGLLAAADAFAPIAEALRLNMAKIGIDASALLGPMFSQIALASNDTFRAASQGAQAFADTLHAFRANELPLTIGQITAFGTEAQTAFNQAVAGGATTQEAFVAIAPLLAQLQSASSQYGFTLDKNTQSLIDQATAAGVAFPTDPVDKLVAAVQKLIDYLSHDLVDSAKAAGDALNNIPSGPVVQDTSGVWGDPGSGGYTPEQYKHAAGGVATRATVGIFGEAGPEALIPLDQYGGGILTEQAMNTMLSRFERSIIKAFVSAAQKGN